MSEPLETAAAATGGGIGAIILRELVSRWFRKGDDDARHFTLSLAAHREQLEALKISAATQAAQITGLLEEVRWLRQENKRLDELETRLAFREGKYGAEPLSSPGYRSPVTEALVKQHRSNDGE